jgi:hypothetical protein
MDFVQYIIFYSEARQVRFRNEEARATGWVGLHHTLRLLCVDNCWNNNCQWNIEVLGSFCLFVCVFLFARTVDAGK